MEVVLPHEEKQLRLPQAMFSCIQPWLKTSTRAKAGLRLILGVIGLFAPGLKQEYT